jgi:hypothetical protein
MFRPLAKAGSTRRGEHRLTWWPAYRVLLTRARAGVVIYVPRGEPEDDTRRPSQFEAVAEALVAAGCAPLTTAALNAE